MKKTLFLLIALSVFSGCNPPTTTDTATTAEKKEKTVIEFPQTQEDCLAKGGIWKKVGIFPNEICNIPTKDGGKECSSSNDCEGSCLAVLTEDQRSLLMNGKKLNENVPGKCTGMLRNFGCIGFVENSKVDKFLCLD
jgi:hypothetical protein